jgi:stage II sporulation protein GA (sporulation sigma-E factor processing peptidase)
LTVYVDILLAVNIFVNYFLLLASAKMLHCEIKRIRLFLSSVLGSLYSLIIFLPELPEEITVLVNFAASAVLTAIAFSPKSFKVFLREVAVFFGVNFAFAGIMLGIWLAFKPSGMVFNNSVVYFNIDIKILTVSTVACYVIIMLISRLMKRSAPSDSVYSVTFSNSGRSVTVNALLDTGNTLKDGFSGKPVIIADESVFASLTGFVPEDCFRGNNALDMMGVQNKIRLIAYNTVGEKGFLKAVSVDSVSVRADGREYTVRNALVAQSKTRFTNGEYSAILNNDFFERTNSDDKRIHTVAFGKN